MSRVFGHVIWVKVGGGRYYLARWGCFEMLLGWVRCLELLFGQVGVFSDVIWVIGVGRCYLGGRGWVDVIWISGSRWKCYLGKSRCVGGWMEMLYGWVSVGRDVIWVGRVDGDNRWGWVGPVAQFSDTQNINVCFNSTQIWPRTYFMISLSQ